MSTPKIQSLIQASVDTKLQLLGDAQLLSRIDDARDAVVRCFAAGGKVLFCGNGGSAADAQHLAAEFSGRFYTDRDPLPSEALHCNSSYMTAVANDYGYDVVYSRIIKGTGRKGDVLISLSTSGNSVNIIKAMEQARAMGMTNIALTGSTGGKMKDLADILLNMPSTDTPRIQECHITVGHIICQLAEEEIFPRTV
jgi:D-sedoheptulose 7-phosphate isomerase